MVKLETDEGRVYIDPRAVRSIGPSGLDGCASVQAGVFFCVKGTPDEVHAKLFTPPPLADSEAARKVLEWAAKAEDPWEDELRDLALKALGR